MGRRKFKYDPYEYDNCPMYDDYCGDFEYSSRRRSKRKPRRSPSPYSCYGDPYDDYYGYGLAGGLGGDPYGFDGLNDAFDGLDLGGPSRRPRGRGARAAFARQFDAMDEFGGIGGRGPYATTACPECQGVELHAPGCMEDQRRLAGRFGGSSARRQHSPPTYRTMHYEGVAPDGTYERWEGRMPDVEFEEVRQQRHAKKGKRNCSPIAIRRPRSRSFSIEVEEPPSPEPSSRRREPRAATLKGRRDRRRRSARDASPSFSRPSQQRNRDSAKSKKKPDKKGSRHKSWKDRLGFRR